MCISTPYTMTAESNPVEQVVLLLLRAKRYQHEKLTLNSKRSHIPCGQMTDRDVMFSLIA